MRCAVDLKHTLDFEHLKKKDVKHLINDLKLIIL